MSFNLVDLVKSQISDQVLGQISNAVGENSEATKSVVNSTIPALLGGLMDKASSDDGATALFDTIKNTDDSILDNLSGVIASKNKDSLMEGGSNMLGALFGGEAASGLVGAISGASGASQGSASSIVGMVAPMAMGTVKRYMAGGGEMDQAGLVGMLMGQKDNITGAMPEGLADQLGSSGFLSNVGNLLGDGAGTATAAVTSLTGAAGSAVADASDTVTSAVGDVADNAADKVGDVAEDGASWIKKLIPIIVLAALAFLALKFFGSKAPEAPEVSTTTPAVGQVAQSGDVTEQLKGMFGSAQTALGSITDVDSAKEALPKLEDFSGKLDGISSMADKLPDAAKPMFNAVVQGGLGQMQPMLDKVMAIPGVGAVLGGVIDPLKEKLTALGG